MEAGILAPSGNHHESLKNASVRPSPGQFDYTPCVGDTARKNEE